MAEAILIDLSNYDTMLKESTQGRSGTPDGNIFFDITNGRVELITKEEKATIPLPKARTGYVTVSVNATAKTFTRSSGSFITDGFDAGQTIITTGFTNSGNNTTKTIDSVTETVITVTDNTGLVDETGDGNEFVQGFGTAEDNPLTNQTGIFIGALYAFERLQRRVNEELRKYDFFSKGTFKYAGAYEIVNSRKFDILTSSVGDDREKLRGSGWIERALDGGVDRIYFGARSLGNIEATSEPYYQLEEGGAPTNFEKSGPIDEAVQVYGSTSNIPSDADAGNFSKLLFLSNKVRTYGYNYDEKTLADSGITEMSGYSAGFALGETPHLTTDPELFPLADVYGVGQKSPWTGMTLEKLASAQEEGGFNEANGFFTWVLHNSENGTLDECVAFLDALAQTDDDIDNGELTETRGKRVRTWYAYDAAGRVITRSGADDKGLFIENVPTADRQRIQFLADDGDLRSYPFMIDLKLVVGANAAADPNGWYHVWKAVNYGTPSAETVLDSADQPMKGSTYGYPNISREYDWVGGGSVPLDIVVECEGDGIATQAKTEATITETPIVSVVVSPGLETNM